MKLFSSEKFLIVAVFAYGKKPVNFAVPEGIA